MSPPATLRNLSAQTIVSKQQALLEGQPKARSQKFMAMFLETIIAIFIESGQFSPVNHNKRLMKDMEDMTKHNELVSDDVPSKDSNDDFNPIELFYPEHPSFIVEINFEENPKRCASFYRHLIGNCSEKIKLQKLPGDNFSFMVILPVLALISVTPDKHVVQIYSLSKSSLLNAKIVYETIQETKDDFKRSQYEFLEITDTPGRQALRPSTHASGVTEVENCTLYQTLLRLFMHCCPESSTPTLREDNNSTILSEATSSVYLEEESTDVREETNVEEIEVGITSLSLRQNCKTTRQENKKTQTSTQHDCEKESEIKNLKATVSSLEEHLSYSKRAFSELKSVSDATQANMREELYKLRNKVDDLEKKLESAEEEQQQTLLELGRHSVENGRLINEMKFIETFKSKPVSVTSTATQVPQQPLLNQASTLPQGETASNTQSSRVIVQNPLGTSAGISVQVSENSSGIEGISLANVPATFVERTVYNHYNLLLLAISDALLIRDVQDVKTWASRMFSINVTIDMSIHDVFLELDRKKVISASNLNLLRSFFEEKQRFDLVHLIDCFESGDYNHLSTSKINGVSRVRRQSASHSAESRGPCSETRIIPDVSSTRRTNSSQSSASNQSKVLEVDESFTVKQPKHKMSILVTTRSPMDTLGNENGKATGSASNGNGSRQNTVQDRMTGSKNVSVGNVQRSNRETGCSQAGKKDKQSSENSKAQSAETPGNHSASPQECDSDDDDDSQWLCSHYKRRCHVKFDCCNKYWPCHRCHNNAGKCSENKLKSRDTKYIKCAKCGKEQKFTAQSQFCNKCHTKLARYFCAICKHLTGTDDHPYHCSKCGICRIHHDRSFHCDVCGVCLDVQLRGNHKCRAGSAHDECCICLEDAFTGCQILPCSHKVHKECATRMIRSGITRCPICRESFAHKLEKRPLPSSKKSNGKH